MYDFSNHSVIAVLISVQAYSKKSLRNTRSTPRQRKWYKKTIGLHCRISHGRAILNEFISCRGVQRVFRKLPNDGTRYGGISLLNEREKEKKKKKKTKLN